MTTTGDDELRWRDRQQNRTVPIPLPRARPLARPTPLFRSALGETSSVRPFFARSLAPCWRRSPVSPFAAVVSSSQSVAAGVPREKQDIGCREKVKNRRAAAGRQSISQAGKCRPDDGRTDRRTRTYVERSFNRSIDLKSQFSYIRRDRDMVCERD